MADIRKRDGKKPHQVRFIDPSTKSGFGYKSFRTAKEARHFAAQCEIAEPNVMVRSDITTIEQAIDLWLEIPERRAARIPASRSRPRPWSNTNTARGS